MKMILLYIFISFFSLLLILVGWASWPWSIGEDLLKAPVITVEILEISEMEESPSVIKVLTWNLGFLFGKGSEGPGYSLKDRSFYEEKLNQMVKEIQEWAPDVVCLQEVDFDSHRSHNIDQAVYLATKAGYPYVAKAPSWEANYVPFPYWPISNHFGRMNSGGAILSKYPIKDHELVLLQKPHSQPWWYNLFYIHRYFQKATLDLGEKDFSLINLHLEAFDKKDRQEQVKRLQGFIEQWNVKLIAGDFNMLPAGATKKSKFKDGDDYEDDDSHSLMLKSGLLEVIPEEIYLKTESNYFTFPADRPDRRLDYIFYRPEIKLMKTEVLTSTVSDHLPIKASFQIDSPKFNPYSQ